MKNKPLSQAYAEAMEVKSLEQRDAVNMYDYELSTYEGREQFAQEIRPLTLAVCKMLEAAEGCKEWVYVMVLREENPLHPLVKLEDALAALRAELTKRGDKNG